MPKNGSKIAAPSPSDDGPQTTINDVPAIWLLPSTAARAAAGELVKALAIGASIGSPTAFGRIARTMIGHAHAWASPSTKLLRIPGAAADECASSSDRFILLSRALDALEQVPAGWSVTLAGVTISPARVRAFCFDPSGAGKAVATAARSPVA